jgi:DNA repair photolyase
MQALYEPKGAALEYASLAVNLYRGCPGKCEFCYCPGQLHMSREDFHAAAAPRPGLLDALARDIVRRELRGLPRARVHLCFTTDPWAPTDAPIIALALLLLRDAGYPVSTLTKQGLRAWAELGTLASMDATFGVSLSWADDGKRAEWEPGTAPVRDRLESLARAKDLGLPTWASVEPVIDPAEGLAAIDSLIPLVDEIKVGRWNHDRRAHGIDWAAFARAAKAKLEASGKRYVLKRGLAELVG